MGKLIFSVITSLDGYVADERGNFDWAAPDEEVHQFVNDRFRPITTHLYGRRMYEVMVFWETEPAPGSAPAYAQDFADIWRAADKVVYSRTLTQTASAKTRIETSFDPHAVRQLKFAADADLAIGGPDLAGQAIEAGLVDEVHLFIAPVVVGGGARAFPVSTTTRLALLESRSFSSGMVYLKYAVVPEGES